jgi:hypothetical protein
VTWDFIVAEALAHRGTVLTTYYGDQAVKANDRPVVTPSREPDSFCLHIDHDTVEMLKETDPETFWQTPHYEGWPGVLVRFASDDPERVRAMIGRSVEWAKSRKPPRKR